MLERSERPWGEFSVLHTSAVAQIKEIKVKAGSRLSYQTHKLRAEHWFIVQGPAVVTIDGATHTLESGTSVDFGFGVAHRKAAPSTNDVVFIEVQTGTYFVEYNIVRL